MPLGLSWFVIKALLFDVGGVLLTGKMSQVNAAFASSLGVSSSFIQGRVDSVARDLLSGALCFTDFVHQFTAELHLHDRDVLALWKQAYLLHNPVNTSLLSLLQKNFSSYRLAVVSNMSSLDAEMNTERGLFLGFDNLFLSCDLGLLKPQVAFFRHVLDELGLDASACVFIDDKAENIAVAEQMGFETVHFTDVGSLYDSLAAKGI